jgi:hypothetical protein
MELATVPGTVSEEKHHSTRPSLDFVDDAASILAGAPGLGRAEGAETGFLIDSGGFGGREPVVVGD